MAPQHLTPSTTPARAYATDADGQSPVVVRMKVTGDLGRNFLDFVANRASWLSLSGWAESPSHDHAVVVAAGPEALVGALEMACLLGPIDALVHGLELEDETQPVPLGFGIRRSP
jgi:acylphosphatase